MLARKAITGPAWPGRVLPSEWSQNVPGAMREHKINIKHFLHHFLLRPETAMKITTHPGPARNVSIFEKKKFFLRPKAGPEALNYHQQPGPAWNNLRDYFRAGSNYYFLVISLMTSVSCEIVTCLCWFSTL